MQLFLLVQENIKHHRMVVGSKIKFEFKGTLLSYVVNSLAAFYIPKTTTSELKKKRMESDTKQNHPNPAIHRQQPLPRIIKTSPPDILTFLCGCFLKVFLAHDPSKTNNSKPDLFSLWDPKMYYHSGSKWTRESWQWRGISPFPDLQDWSFTIRCSLLSY